MRVELLNLTGTVEAPDAFCATPRKSCKLFQNPMLLFEGIAAYRVCVCKMRSIGLYLS